MSQIHLCVDRSDTTSLCAVYGLFLKPIARINITVHFPTLKQSIPTGGKSVSSWEVMEKMKALVSPEHFISLKVVKNTLEFIRFEGDLESRSIMKTIVSRIDGKTLKITGFKDPLKIRAAETRLPFPSKYDWDSFFRDAKHMNEMKPGERPDTIHFQSLPSKWFSDKKSVDKPVPSEKLFRRVWETFGEVRCVDIPVLDPYRQQMQSSIAGIKTFTFSQDPVFEAYVQYKDYLSFVKAMDALRNCFLVYQEDNKCWVASVKVNFDKTKHLSDESIRKRKTERERLIAEEKLREKAKLKVKTAGKDVAAPSNAKSAGLSKDDTECVEYKIAKEERMYMVARRKLESVRLLDYIFDRIKKRRDVEKKSSRAEDSSCSDHENQSESDRLSPSFYSVERSPRIEKCRISRSPSPRNTRSPKRNSSPGRNRSPYHSRSRSRGRSRSPYHHHSREREKSRSRSPYDRKCSPFDNRDRYHDKSRSRSRERSRSRSRSLERYTGRSPDKMIPRSRSPQEGRYNDGRYYEPEPHDRQFRENHPMRYMNDWEIKSHRGGFHDRGRGRGGFRGRGFMYRNSRGRVPFHRSYYNNPGDPRRHDVDPHSLQEAYNHAYTKYFNSISKASSSTGKPEDDMESDRSSRSACNS